MAKDYDRYEYVVVTISRQLSMVCQETYEAFGWEIYESNRHSDGVQLHMRRPRKIKERSRVMAEQRKMEDALMIIEQCENNKKLGPTIAAIMKAQEGDMSWLRKIILKGSTRLTQKHLDAISMYKGSVV